MLLTPSSEVSRFLGQLLLLSMCWGGTVGVSVFDCNLQASLAVDTGKNCRLKAIDGERRQAAGCRDGRCRAGLRGRCSTCTVGIGLIIARVSNVTAAPNDCGVNTARPARLSELFGAAPTARNRTHR